MTENITDALRHGDTRTADPMAQREETRRALADPVYLDGFNAVMSGRAGELTPEQAEAVRLVRHLTGTPAPGLPMPVEYDDTAHLREAEPGELITEDGAR